MEKINIAELLRDCPKGMELDCTMYENVEFDYIEQSPESKYPIHCLTRINGGCNTLVFTHNGCNDRHPNAKCVIFPKGKTTWEGFHRPFKDGDIVTFDNPTENYLQIFIFKDKKENNTLSSCYLMLDGDKLVLEEDMYYVTRLATEEEKQKLFDAIKANGYRWNAETKTLEELVEPKFKVGDRVKHIPTSTLGIVTKVDDAGYYIAKVKGIRYISFSLEKDYELAPNKFDITTLVPFESKVLVRNVENQRWIPSFWGYKRDNGYITTFGWCQYCIPYECNEHLLNTANDCDTFYKTWEK